ncbi:hypothetical protein V6Z11_D11G134200 [Gossypium hirsutum]|uniref:Transcription factor SCREAM2 isoform X1 n=2 Tax=Gossypium TaxID=3633 RepID=A0A1U8K543_GOSHI|nr:transcription factor SCREAM2-like isoform X1 [Gossypium hirsutum]TYH43591.1 hypothetical protein ES332_D11G137100v1 [Gossypium tomentosum]
MGVSFLSCETEKSLLLSLPPSSIFSSQANKHSSISFLISSLGYQVEVRLREGRAVNIHMFCARRAGLLLSTMRALDNLGLDIQQAVISCFNGFALDVFRAEQCREGQDVLPEQIKAVLLDSAGFRGIM